jgi:hypothetical protein
MSLRGEALGADDPIPQSDWQNAVCLFLRLPLPLYKHLLVRYSLPHSSASPSPQQPKPSPCPTPAPPTSIHITLYIDRQEISTFFHIWEPFYAQVVAEPKCIFAELCQAPDKPGVFKFVENWNEGSEWLMDVRTSN